MSIRERPADIEDRAVPRHWEGDLLFGSGNSQIATLVERSTRYVMLVKVDRKDTKTVVDALIEHARQLPNQLYQSLTWDRGKELADHRRFTLATDIQVYSCDPQSPWQRGSNENTNGLLRQYFPKGIDVSGFTQAQLDEVAKRLNERPRKTMNFETSIERYHQAVALTGCNRHPKRTLRASPVTRPRLAAIVAAYLWRARPSRTTLPLSTAHAARDTCRENQPTATPPGAEPGATGKAA